MCRRGEGDNRDNYNCALVNFVFELESSVQLILLFVTFVCWFFSLFLHSCNCSLVSRLFAFQSNYIWWLWWMRRLRFRLQPKTQTQTRCRLPTKIYTAPVRDDERAKRDGERKSFGHGHSPISVAVIGSTVNYICHVICLMLQSNPFYVDSILGRGRDCLCTTDCMQRVVEFPYLWHALTPFACK